MRRINRLLYLQDNVARYYKKMAGITTESDLKNIFLDLEELHKSTKSQLEYFFFRNENRIQSSLRKQKSFFGKLWRKVLIAVLVNNRKKLIEYCRQNEIKLLQELNTIISTFNYGEEVSKVLTDYEKSIYTYVDKLGALPEVKLYAG